LQNSQNFLNNRRNSSSLTRLTFKSSWDNQWKNEDEYLQWSISWVRAATKVLKDDGLFYIFGQLGKCEHIWLHFCSMVAKELQFHDI
jgi:DNA modification methylase